VVGAVVAGTTYERLQVEEASVQEPRVPSVVFVKTTVPVAPVVTTALITTVVPEPYVTGLPEVIEAVVVDVVVPSMPIVPVPMDVV
jgi:hypothetical protein